MLPEKNLSDRLFRLNELFNRRFGANSAISTEELKVELGIERSQLFKDFAELKTLGAPLVYDRFLRGHRYTAIFPISDRILFDAEELVYLRIGVELLSKIPNLKGFQQLPETFDKIRRAVTKWSMEESALKAVYFDPLPHYDGGKHLPFLYQAIENQWQVKFDYQSFHAPQPKTVVFDPYFLRHYDRRWYLGGFSHDISEGFVRTFPLERIHGVPTFNGRFFDKQRGFEPEQYWRYIYGITVPPGGIPENVVIAFKDPQDKYFISTPFFEPFQVLEMTPAKMVVSFRLIPNIDLVRKLASYGDKVKVLEPVSLAEEIRLLHKRATAQYGQSSAT